MDLRHSLIEILLVAKRKKIWRWKKMQQRGQENQTITPECLSTSTQETPSAFGSVASFSDVQTLPKNYPER
jgi:hypothetical protein